MKNTVIRARIDSRLKADAVRVLAACGLEPSDAIRLFLQQVVPHQGIPIDIRSAVHAPSMAELQVLKRKSQKRDHRIAKSVVRRTRGNSGGGDAEEFCTWRDRCR